MSKEHVFPAGTYYVGDLCYILGGRCDEDVWDEVCDLTIKNHECLEGIFTLSDGREFAMYGTKWGDGVYYDQHCFEYFVDSGSIGCIKVPEGHTGIDGGKIAVFDKPFVTSSRDGVISFGELAIDTDPKDYDEEEEEN